MKDGKTLLVTAYLNLRRRLVRRTTLLAKITMGVSILLMGAGAYFSGDRGREPNPSEEMRRPGESARIEAQARTILERALVLRARGGREDPAAADLAREALERLGEAGPLPTFQARFLRCQALRIAGRHSDALAETDLLLVGHERFASGIVERGEILLEMGRLEEAQRDFARALEIDPGSERARTLLETASKR